MPGSEVIIVSVLAIVLVVLLIVEHRIKKRKAKEFARLAEPSGRAHPPRWTDRFIFLPISVYNVKEQEITGSADSVDSYLKTLPTNIVEYRPTFLESRPDQEATEITKRNGDTAVITLSVQQFEETMNEFCQRFDG